MYLAAVHSNPAFTVIWSLINNLLPVKIHRQIIEHQPFRLLWVDARHLPDLIQPVMKGIDVQMQLFRCFFDGLVMPDVHPDCFQQVFMPY